MTLATWLLRAGLALSWALCAAHLLLPDDGMVLAVGHAFTGYWAPLGGVLLVVATALKLWPEAAAAVPVTLLWLGWTVPGTLGSAHVSGEVPLRVVSANVLMVHPDPAVLRDELMSHDADVLLLQEVSGRWEEALQEVVDVYPYHLIVPRPDSFGVAVLSKRPLLSADVRDLGGVDLLDVTVGVGGGEVRLLDVHTLPPRSVGYAPVWHAQMDQLARMVEETDGPVIVAGDLNATRHHPSYRDLLAETGLRDAHAEVGRAAAKTWPNGLFPAPSLRLDHVLVGEGVEVFAVHEGQALGSDHSPIVVDLVL